MFSEKEDIMCGNNCSWVLIIILLLVCCGGCFGAAPANNNILPSVTESMVSDIIIAVLNVLAAIGVIIDPTTAGMSDSSQAMNYEKPKEE